MFSGHVSAQLNLLSERFIFPPLLLQYLRKEDDKDDEEDYKDQKDLDHQPTVGGDRLEIFEDL